MIKLSQGQSPATSFMVKQLYTKHRQNNDNIRVIGPMHAFRMSGTMEFGPLEENEATIGANLSLVVSLLNISALGSL
ncbi:hypothetical protein PVK06_025653 [Gossypium arboreum]|uniref:Uncharacterized protein n=1 Tax=Gossypium arboreum TaxID=29729 RepID=A0ABR0NYW0_GOSAR|nr:hypothetical protein PVK06_025653 [Gossypium arboreum]